jgi:hypothetical protein
LADLSSETPSGGGQRAIAIGRTPAEYRRSHLVQLSALRLGEKFLVGIFGRAL